MKLNFPKSILSIVSKFLPLFNANKSIPTSLEILFKLLFVADVVTLSSLKIITQFFADVFILELNKAVDINHNN